MSEREPEQCGYKVGFKVAARPYEVLLELAETFIRDHAQRERNNRNLGPLEQHGDAWVARVGQDAYLVEGAPNP
jgi:hypothetical protein